MLTNQKKTVILLYVILLFSTILIFALVFKLGAKYSLLAYLSILAYTLGVRHGFDADHIAAIDNSTRKFMQEGKRPLLTGTWFSLGHSTIVISLIIVLVIATRSVISSVGALRSIGSIIGTLVSAVFLIIIGIVNLFIAYEIYDVFRGSIEGKNTDPGKLEDILNKRGFLGRYLGRFMKHMTRPRDLYPLGLLFGLGFDTASEIALISISVGVGASSVPIYAVFLLPALFTVGMVLVDTSDGVFMSFAYSWAFLRPVRKLYYNLVTTMTSVLIALGVGVIEAIQLISRSSGASGPFWNLIESLNFSTMGVIIVTMLATTWGASVAYYRYKDIGSYDTM